MMNDLIKTASDAANSLYGLPGDLVLALFCVSFGYFLKLSPWFPNKYIPTAVMAAGLIGGPLLYMGHYDHAQSMTSQILYHVMIGGAVSLGAWLLHANVLKRFEHKIPILGALLADANEQPPPAPAAPELKKEGTNVPLLFLALSLSCGGLVACTSFATHVFRVEQTAVHLAYTGYVGWTNYMQQFPVSPQASNEVKRARLQFAATVATLDNLRGAYETNSAVKPQLQATLETLAGQSSNVVWLINYWKGIK